MNLAMNPKELMELLEDAMNNRMQILVSGAPGIGKSQIITEVAIRLGWDIILSHPVVCDPTDYKGMPTVIEGLAEFLPFGDLRRMIEATVPTIVFLDDIGQAPQCVQAALMQLIEARQINGQKVSDHVLFMGASNRRTDKAGVGGMIEPLKSRFKGIVELQVDLECWTHWAIEHGMPPEIIGFVNFRPDLLHTNEKSLDLVEFPCPRTMVAAGEWINIGRRDLKTMAMAIGQGAAIDLVGFMKVFNDLPDLNGIIDDPINSLVPENKKTGVLYAIAAGLINKGTMENIKNIFKYADRLSNDFKMLLVRGLLRKLPQIEKTPMWNKWVTANADLFF